MLKRPHYIALTLVVLLTLALFAWQGRVTSSLKRAIGGLYLPLFGVAAFVDSLSHHLSSATASKTDLLAEVENLRRQNAELTLQVVQLEEVARDANILRDHFGMQRHLPWKVKLARVVGRDPANWWRNIRINLGSRDGLSTNHAVLTGEGLVGRVAEVGVTHSVVALLGDPDCRVGVLVDESREHGAIAPSSRSPLDDQIVELGYLSRNSQLRPGQKVMTSGYGGIFPKGILVGHVVDTRPVQFGLYREARVKLAANLSALEEVWVILP